MDIYLTGHLVLAFGIFAKIYPINQSNHSKSIKQINLYILIIRPFFFVLGLKQKKILRDFPALSFLSVLPLTIIPNTPIRDK